jgi:hypothetical protein
MVHVRCSPVAWPRVCSGEVERSSCATDRYGELLNDCFQEAHAQTSDPSRQALLDGALGMPRTGIRETLRLASQLANNSDSDSAKALMNDVKTLNQIARPLSQLNKLFDPRQSPEERVRVLGQNGAALLIDNGLSRELTTDAISAAANSNRAAMNSLVKELEQLSARIEQIEDNAISTKLETNKQLVAEAIEDTRQRQSQRLTSCNASTNNCYQECNSWTSDGYPVCQHLCSNYNAMCKADVLEAPDAAALNQDWLDAMQAAEQYKQEIARQQQEQQFEANMSAFLNGLVSGLRAVPQPQTRQGGGGGDCSSGYVRGVCEAAR